MQKKLSILSQPSYSPYPACPPDSSGPVEPTAEEIALAYDEFVEERKGVDLWHFPMMNDSVRNAAYESALKSALQKHKTVLDIGTGSGLLAMMAARHGALQVTTCEEIPRISRKAREIIESNGYGDKIRVVNKRSTAFIMGKDLPEPADVLVTEIFDDGLLGEGAFVAIEHARKQLLRPLAQIIPCGVSVMAMCIESQEIFENHRVTQASGFDLSAFNEFSIKGYMGYHLDKVKYKALSAPKKIFEFDFYHLPQDESISLEFESVSSGTCHAIAYWYHLHLDEKTSISTAPGLPQLSSWKQAIQLLENPRQTEKGEISLFKAHHNSDAIWFTVN